MFGDAAAYIMRVEGAVSCSVVLLYSVYYISVGSYTCFGC